ncbi:MAG: hypothetical protein GEU91_03840 [Rhizobiales bacterium]|nr:hypothetical protein [Hyphomicrobiales bacterium]
MTNVVMLSGIAAVALAISGLSADAAPKKRAPAVSQGEVNVSSQSRTRQVRQVRSRTRITVRPRSYLDGGTEVWSGERKFNDYAISPTQSAVSVLDNTAFYHRSPLPGPFDLPGKNNPIQW